MLLSPSIYYSVRIKTHTFSDTCVCNKKVFLCFNVRNSLLRFVREIKIRPVFLIYYWEATAFSDTFCDLGNSTVGL